MFSMNPPPKNDVSQERENDEQGASNRRPMYVLFLPRAAILHACCTLASVMTNERDSQRMLLHDIDFNLNLDLDSLRTSPWHTYSSRTTLVSAFVDFGFLSSISVSFVTMIRPNRWK